MDFFISTVSIYLFFCFQLIVWKLIYTLYL
nr:MAG TPA: hypothetical protein [Caudoviricetes sp.]